MGPIVVIPEVAPAEVDTADAHLVKLSKDQLKSVGNTEDSSQRTVKRIKGEGEDASRSRRQASKDCQCSVLKTLALIHVSELQLGFEPRESKLMSRCDWKWPSLGPMIVWQQ